MKSGGERMTGLSVGMQNTYGTSLLGGSYGTAYLAATTPSGESQSVDGTTSGVKAGMKSSPADCETCRERKYVDGSDENVSFKSASHISPQAAPAMVRSHEQEHVSNAYTKASQGDGEVVSAGVAIHTSVCPECGRTYVSGGTTTTMIRYPNESNPYQQNRKAVDGAGLTGANIDMAV